MVVYAAAGPTHAHAHLSLRALSLYIKQPHRSLCTHTLCPCLYVIRTPHVDIHHACASPTDCISGSGLMLCWHVSLCENTNHAQHMLLIKNPLNTALPWQYKQHTTGSTCHAQLAVRVL
jgi:hypothetical protein